MKTIGLLGGMSWESTKEYYRILNEVVREKMGGLHSAKCLLYSVDFQPIEELLQKKRWSELTEILSQAALKLKIAGADFLVICTNTMHKLASNIETLADMEILHIADSTGEIIKKKGLKKVCLLGTDFTMRENFYSKRLLKHGIETIIPDDKDMETVNRIIFDELCRGIIKENSKLEYISIMNKAIENGAQGIILGCTEIPLLVNQKDVTYPIFDTTVIHATGAAMKAIYDDDYKTKPV